MRTLLLSFTVIALACVLVGDGTAGPARAALPGHNGKIVFGSDRTGDFEIWVMDAGGSNQMNLTNNPASDRVPAWSPDGTKIAFTSDRGGDSDVWVMNADGTGLTNLTNNPAFDFGPSWSPDGTRIAFESERAGGGGVDIYTMNADGTGPARVTTSGIEQDAAWSPDGQWLAFDSQRNGADIWIVRPDGSDETRLGADGTADYEPAWSPNGQRIAWVGSQEQGYAVFVMNRDGTGQTRIGDATRDETTPEWSPDGTKIVFSGDAGGGGGDIFVMNPDGSGLAQLTDSPGNNWWPSWQPLPVKAGDADCDDDVDTVDALQAQRYVAGLPAAGCVLKSNVKCSDPLDTVDALFVLRHVAGLPVTLPPGCTGIGGLWPGIVSTGTGTLSGSWGFDFDAGVQVSGGTGDVQWDQRTQTDRAIEARDDALIVNVGVVDFAGLTLDGLKTLTYGTDPINGSDDPTNLLVPGDVFAVLTREGNYAKVLVVEYGYSLTLQWVTYLP